MDATATVLHGAAQSILVASDIVPQESEAKRLSALPADVRAMSH